MRNLLLARMPRPLWLLILIMVLAVAGCASKRDLPPMPPLADLQRIDLCALAPTEQIRTNVSDAIGRGWHHQVLGACWFESPAGFLSIELAADPLPNWIAENDDEVTVTPVAGGRVLTDKSIWAHCTVAAVSDRGYVIDVHGPPGDTGCAVAEKLATVVLGTLAEKVTNFDWPAGTAGTRDLCGAVAEAKVAETLGIKNTEITVHTANRFSCSYGLDLTISFDTRLSIPGMNQDTPDKPVQTTVAGRPAVSAKDGCLLSIDLGDNPVLANQIKGGRDALEVSYRSEDCGKLPAALEPLVRDLAH